MQLVKYEQARYALAECHRVDEVKDIRDKAEAMAAYARQAKDQELILWATEIKVRAERRAGEMLAQVPREQHSGRRPSNSSDDKTNYQKALEASGLTQSAAYQMERIAAIPDEHFETAIDMAKQSAGQVTTAFMLREAEKHRPSKRMTQVAKQRLKDMEDAKSRGVSMLATSARLTLTALQAQTEFNDAEKSALVGLFDALKKVSFLQGE